MSRTNRPPRVSNMAMMLDSKMFSACFAPAIPPCMTPSEKATLPAVTYKKSGKDDRKAQLRGSSSSIRGVKKHVASSAYRRHDSFMPASRDEDSDLLLAELDLTPSEESSSSDDSDDDDDDDDDDDSGSDYSSSVGTKNDLNTIMGDDLLKTMRKTLGENKTITNGHFVQPNSKKNSNGKNNNNNDNGPHPISPSSSAKTKYDKSIRNRFNYMRLQHKFSSNNGQDPPSDRSVESFKSGRTDENSSYAKYGLQRRNELAKQILKRRKDVVVNSRTGFDPPTRK